MPNILIRDLSQEAVDRIDTAAANLGLSRNEYLRRRFEGDIVANSKQTVTAEDWQRSAEVFADLADPAVMDAAGTALHDHAARTRVLSALRRGRPQTIRGSAPVIDADRAPDARDRGPGL